MTNSLWIGASVVAGALILELAGVETLRAYTGGASPPLVAALVMLAGAWGGAGAMRVRRTGWRNHFPNLPGGVVRFSLVALLAFSASAVAADVLWRFPMDINAPLPWSPLHYLVLAGMAVTVFQVLPFTLAIWVMDVLKVVPTRMGLLVVAVVISMMEPLLQLFWAIRDGSQLQLAGFTFVQVLVFDLASLWVFAARGLGAVFLFRLAYYAWWHVGWGVVRLWLWT